MRHIPIAEFKDRVSEFVAAAEAGEEIMITRHGRVAARIGPPELDRAARRKAVIDQMLAIGKANRERHGGVSIEEIIAWKNEGRR